MIKSKQLASLAAGLAAGNFTHDEILDKLGGDRNLLKEVIGMAGGFGVGIVASSLTEKVIENTPLNDICEEVDGVVGGLVSDVFSIFD